MTETAKEKPPSRLERAIGYLFPAIAVRRAVARMRLNMARRYEGAAAGRRTDLWRAQGTSANVEIGLDIRLLRDRHRDLCRNNPWASRAVNAVVANTVGIGIKAKIEGAAGGKKASKVLASAWSAWAETTEIDAEGQNDIYGLQALIMRAVEESGECLVRARWRTMSDPLTVPLQIQVVEADYLDTGRTELLDTGRIVHGVEFDKRGRRVAYWLFDEHPGEIMFGQAISRRIDAHDIAHIYKKTRPGQVRGVPSAAPVMLSLRDLDDYEDAFLLRQKIANLATAIITDAEDYGSTTTNPANVPALPDTMEPGAILVAPGNKKVEFNTPPSAGDYGPFTKDVLRRVAAAYGLTYATLTGDLSDVNFSSGRMGWLDMQRNIGAWQWLMLIPMGCDRIASWFGQAAKLKGISDGGVKATWSPPRREMIDPTKEIPAQIEAIAGGLTTQQEYWRQNGDDPETMLDEIEDFQTQCRERGITVTTIGGAPKAQPQPQDNQDAGNNAAA